MSSRNLIRKMIKYAFENKESREYLLPIIKTNYKKALSREEFSGGVLKKLGEWHKEKYGGNLKYPSLFLEGKKVGFDTYINYYKSKDVEVKKEAKGVIKRAYVEFQKDNMEIPLEDLIKIAYENKGLRKSLLGILKKAYAEERESVEKGNIPRKTWDLMIDWHKNKYGEKKYPSLREEGKEVLFSTYQSYYNSGNNKLKNDATKLVQKLYPEFKEDYDKVDKEKKETEESLKEKEIEQGKRQDKKKFNQIREKRINMKVDRIIDYMERSIQEIDGELFVKKLDLSEEDEEAVNMVLEKTVSKMSEVVQNRMNNVAGYEELSGVKKIGDSILGSILGGSKKMVEVKEQWASSLIRATEWSNMAYNKKSIKKSYKEMVDSFTEAEETEKESVVEEQFEKLVNKKHIEDIDLKIFDTLSENGREIENLRSKITDDMGALEKKRIKLKIKRLLNKKKTQENYILNEEKERVEKVIQNLEDEEEKQKQQLVIAAIESQGETLLSGDTHILSSLDDSIKTEYNAKDSFLELKKKEKDYLKKKINEVFDISQEIKRTSDEDEKERLIEKREAILKGLAKKQSEKEHKLGKYEIEEIFDRVSLGLVPDISNFISEIDSYLDEKYVQNVNKEVRDSNRKTSKVLMASLKDAFKKESLESESDLGSDSQIAQDGMISKLSEQAKKKRELAVKKLEEKKEEMISSLNEMSAGNKGNILYDVIRSSIMGSLEKPVSDFLGEKIPDRVIDLSTIGISKGVKELGSALIGNSEIEKLATEFLSKQLGKTGNIASLLEMASKEQPKLIASMIDELHKAGKIGDVMDYFLKGSHLLSEGLNSISDLSSSIADKMGGLSFLADHESVDFLADQVGNLAGGVIKAGSMYLAGEFIESFFEEKYYALFDDPKEKLIQELYNEDKTPKELEEKYRKRIQILEDSLLTDEQWADKYRGQTTTIEEEGMFYGKNKKEVPITAELRGVKRKEASSKAKQLFSENSKFYTILTRDDNYKPLCEKLKKGKIEALADLREGQVDKIIKLLKKKNIDKKELEEMEELYEKAKEAEEEGHSVYDESNNREQVIKEMHDIHKEYEMITKVAMFRSLYLQGRRDEESEQVEGLEKHKRHFKMASEEENKTPLLQQMKVSIIGLTLKQEIDKKKLKSFKNKDIQKTFKGKKPLDKTSFELTKDITKKRLKEKYTT